MDELEIKGKKYISSRRAAELTGYAKDYIGQLARAGKVPGTRVGRSWYVDEESLLSIGKGIEERPGAESRGSSAAPVAAQAPIERAVISPIQLRRSVISPATLQVPGYVLPGTWSAVTYFSDDAALLPSLVNAQNKAEQSSLSGNPTRIRIKIVDALPAPSLATAQIVKKSQDIKGKKGKAEWSGFALPLGALAASLGIFVFLPGLFLSSHASVAGDNGQYSASVIKGLEYVWNTLMQCPPFVQGLTGLESFLSTLRDSSSVFFNKGFQFIGWLLSLV